VGIYLRADEARFVVQGRLLGQSQDATVLLSDFPMATLQPIFRAVPALQNAAPAATAGGPGAALFGPNMNGNNPFSGLAWPFMKCAGIHWLPVTLCANRSRQS